MNISKVRATARSILALKNFIRSRVPALLIPLLGEKNLKIVIFNKETEMPDCPILRYLIKSWAKQVRLGEPREMLRPSCYVRREIWADAFADGVWGGEEGCKCLCNLGRKHRARSSTTILEAEPDKISSLDEKEVSKHVSLADEWWDEQGDLKALHSMNRLRIQLVRDGLIYTKAADVSNPNGPRPLNGVEILDVGCGGGIFTEPLARIGATVTGIDPGQKLIDIAKSHAAEDPTVSGKVMYLCESVEDHAVKNKEKYDAVVASEVIEHVAKKELFLESCASVLKPGGSIFVTTINRTTQAWIAGVITAEYLLHLVPKETHDWEKFITPHELQYMCEKYDCYTKLVHGMFYNFMCNEWYWVQNPAVNYALHAVKKK